jgi:hypothetical protein
MDLCKQSIFQARRKVQTPGFIRTGEYSYICLPKVWYLTSTTSCRISGLWGYQSGLDLYLQEHGIKTLFFAGVNADQV